MGITALRRNEEIRAAREAAGVQNTPLPRPESIPFSKHLNELNDLRTQHKEQLAELMAKVSAAPSTVVDVRGIEELQKILFEGHGMLSAAYDEIVAERGKSAGLEKRVAELEQQLAEVGARLAAVVADGENLKAEGEKLKAEGEKLKADLAAFEELTAAEKPAPEPETKAEPQASDKAGKPSKK